MRIISIWGLLICGAVIAAEAKPIFIKVFAPSGYSSGSYSQSTATVAPVNTQFISNIISQKIQLLNSFLQAKSSFGSIGINKVITFSGSTTTTEKPVTQQTTEVNTDFIPEVSSSTQSVYTTTTEGDIATPKPTVHPERPITTSTPVIPVKSTTEALETTTRATHGYSYRTPTASSISSTVSSYYLPANGY